MLLYRIMSSEKPFIVAGLPSSGNSLHYLLLLCILFMMGGGRFIGHLWGFGVYSLPAQVSVGCQSLDCRESISYLIAGCYHCQSMISSWWSAH